MLSYLVNWLFQFYFSRLYERGRDAKNKHIFVVARRAGSAGNGWVIPNCATETRARGLLTVFVKILVGIELC